MLYNLDMREDYSTWVQSIFSKYESTPFINPIRTDTAKQLRWLFLELCRGLEIKNLMEIGAHEASVSIAFLETSLVPGSRALAIEANPFTYELLTQKSMKYGVEAHNFGLSHSIANLDFFIPVKADSTEVTPGSASFLRRTDENTMYESVTVPTKTIDLVFELELIEGPTALWIDVEGYSLKVIEGAKNRLEGEDIRMVFIEVENYEYWKEQGSKDQVYELLQESGFVLLRRDFEYKFQYNYLFIRANELSNAIKIVNQYDRKFRLLLLKAVIGSPKTLATKMLKKIRAKL